MHIKILVVEDDAARRASLAESLGAQGHFVELAKDGLDALRKVRVGMFDIVLMQVRLPEIDGVAVAKLIADLTHERGRPRLIGLGDLPPQEAGADHLPALFDAVLSADCAPRTVLETVAKVNAALPPPAYPWVEDDDVFASGIGRFGHLIRRAVPRPAALKGGTIDGDLSGKIRVLVVDDDDMLRGVVKAALEQDGYEIETAANGLQAFQEIARSHYHVVVLDVQMPEIDGLATARLVFELLSRADRPRLIALTSAPDYLREREAGSVSVFDEIVSKQVAISFVLAAVRQSAEYKRRRPPVDPISLINLASLAKLLEPESAGEFAPPPRDTGPATEEMLPILDVAALDLVASFLSRQAVAENLRILARKGETLRGHIDSAGARAADEKLVQEAHTVAGSAGLLGFKRLSEMCVRYEKACLGRGGDKAVALAQMRMALEASLQHMAARLSQMADA